jgi:hypothetical protein
MIENTISLIIDDKSEDGGLICDYLRNEFLPYQFYLYDEKKTEEIKSSPKNLTGIRIIFQDLALMSTTHPGKNDYDAAADTIEALLSKRNGPWLLITWSTWSMPDGGGDEYPKQLFDHLHKELPESLRPFDYIAVDKSFFTNDSRHGSAKCLTELTEEQKNKLSEYIKERVSNNQPLHLLAEWEKNAKSAIYSTTSELSQLAMQHTAEPEKALGRIIYELATAYAGKHGENEDYLQHALSEVLSDIIRDKIEHNGTPINPLPSITEFAKIDKGVLEPIGSWKEKLNKAIHIDTHAFDLDSSSPGSIFIIEKEEGIKFLPDEIKNKRDINSFKRRHFLQFLTTEKSEKENICDSIKIICIDITPPCDHANKKSEWNKYMIGVLVPIENEKYCCLLAKTNNGDKERDVSKLLGDNLVQLPKFYLTLPNNFGEFRAIFNSRLTISLPSSHSAEILGNEKVGRVREQLLSDMRSWFIRQTTRPGIIELR